ncbi:glycoside hydrolase family protein [Bizionia saleffrena]|nr:delta-aminolevulinic acid dehydratase [Bizionia saleffrena]
MEDNILDKSFNNLKDFCEKESFKGWDPYDGLNSWVIQKTPLGKSRFLRLAWIQLFKRNPINLRTVFGIKKDYNPKGLGLFLIGYCNLYKVEPKIEYLEKINHLAFTIINLKTEGYSGACWGYNFDWQARAFFQPKYTPTVVATSFIAEALLDAYEITNTRLFLDTAISTKDFVLKDLNKTFDNDGDYTLSYSPLDSTQVFNAGLLGAKLLSLIYTQTNDELLIQEAKKIVAYVCKKQADDGSWAYGTLPFHQWIDNFHTGYNLECIYEYQKSSNDRRFEGNIEKGLNFYLKTFFTGEGISKYYNDSVFPIDIHAPAQLVVTLSKLSVFEENKELIDKVLLWTAKNMQSSEGYFYYQKKKYSTSKIPYIRWAQSWMFYAYSYYFLEKE